MNENIKNKVKTTTIIILILILVAVGIGLWCYFLLPDTERNNMLLTVLLSLFSTIISIILITVGYTIYTEIEFKKSIKDIVIGSLKGDYEIISLYNDKSIRSIINNGLRKILGTDLSKQFIDNVLEERLREISYRTNFDYSVEYAIDNVDATKYKIKQNIEYKKHIKTEKNSLEVSIFFTHKKDPFASKPTENVVFFREELSDFCFQQIKDKTEQEIIDALKLKIKLCNYNTTTRDMDCIDTIRVTKSSDNDVIVFSITVSSNYLEVEEDGFKSFFAKIECEYPSDKNNYFYCVFPEPTKDAEFSICFDMSIVEKSKIHYLSFISTPNYEITQSPNSNGLIFAPKSNLSEDKKKYNTIFPHSGIVLHW